VQPRKHLTPIPHPTGGDFYALLPQSFGAGAFKYDRLGGIRTS
jgi:hypothetical protein